jgi:hypothetical protein
VILEQVPSVNARRQQRVTLQVGGLAFGLERDAHVTD